MALRNIIPTLALFSTCSTLLCCALPALLVSLGAGAVMIGLVGAVPQLIWLSEHKIMLFSFAAMMLLISGISCFLNRNAPCPVDRDKADACMRLRKYNVRVLGGSLILYVIGFYFAFLVQYFP
jgi:hypothetical protein